MARFITFLAVSGILAFLVCLFGCSPLPAGLRLTVAVQGSPLGVSVSVEQAATISPGTPPTWVLEPAPNPPAATTPTTAPAP